MEPMCLTNEYGELTGSFEFDAMKFRVHEDDEETAVQIRLAPSRNELPIYAILGSNNYIHLLSYEVCRALFQNGKPKESETFVEYGTEKLKAHRGQIYQWLDGSYKKRRYKVADLTKHQFKSLTQTRYKWQFKGPLRVDRMRLAVDNTLQLLNENDATFLKTTFAQFRPSEHDTEYGGFQFPDYLTSIGRSDIAFKVAEVFSNVPLGDWTPFDPITNVNIEDARRQQRPMAYVMARGQKYMLVFDVGGGASGQSAVLIRPLRYQKMMESIEEQFHEAAAAQHEEQMSVLFNSLLEHHVNPRLFLIHLVTSVERAIELVPEGQARSAVQAIVERMQTSPHGNVSTRMQQFMPALLEKFKECDVQLSSEETLHPKPLCSAIKDTLTNGLSIPTCQKAHCQDFKTMIHFIQKQQCWQLPKGRNTCDICAKKNQTTLRHCGSTSVCLKCWSDSLIHTNMTCPFCRATVTEGSLAIAPEQVKEKTPKVKRSRKRKRRAFDTPEEILNEIHKDNKYANISLDSKEPMRKWFTILLRRKMVGIAQMPRNEQGKKEFLQAMKAFKLLEDE